VKQQKYGEKKLFRPAKLKDYTCLHSAALQISEKFQEYYLRTLLSPMHKVFYLPKVLNYRQHMNSQKVSLQAVKARSSGNTLTMPGTFLSQKIVFRDAK